MTTMKQWSARALIALVVAAIGFCAYVYVANELLLDRRYPVVRVAVPVAEGSDAVQRGERLSKLTGCSDCHNNDLQGSLFVDEGWLHGHYYASNLTRKARTYSDEDLARIVRDGVRPDGRGVAAMPAMGFVRLTDNEMADIIAFVRSLPVGGIDQPSHYMGPLDRWELWRGRTMKPAVSYVASERGKDPTDAGPEHEASRHLARIVCAECHGGDFKGNGWDTGAPDLAVIRSYGLAEFTRLLRTGIGADGKEHGLMSIVAKSRFYHLTDQEIADLHAYLVARAKLPS
jgi:mono/diheme cytochrome c family protein